MATGAKVIQLFRKADNKTRVGLICDNYSCFENIIDADINSLKNTVADEIRSMKSSRRTGAAELGVRVQGGGGISDPTFNEAANNTMIEIAIQTCDFSNGIIEGIEHEQYVMERAEVLRTMKHDLDSFKMQLGCLQDEEKVYFMPYLLKQKTIYDLADELGFTYKTTYRKIDKIRIKINEGMHPVLGWEEEE